MRSIGYLYLRGLYLLEVQVLQYQSSLNFEHKGGMYVRPVHKISRRISPLSPAQSPAEKITSFGTKTT